MKKTILFCIAILFGISAAGQIGDGLTPSSGYCGTITTARSWTRAYNNGIIYVGQTAPNPNDLVVANGGSLTIEAGVTVIFCTTASDLIISGTGSLTANGTNSNLITFTKLSSNSSWGHLSFAGTGNSQLTYCLIQYGYKTDAGTEGYGGGMYLNSNNPIISNCTIQNNYATNGGGIYVNKSSPHIINCIINNNTAQGTGGGILFDNNCPAIVENCIIRNNVSNSSGSGGGIFAGDNVGNLQFFNCDIVSNTSSINNGNNIRFYNNLFPPYPKFQNCIVWGNANGILFTRATNLASIFVNCGLMENAGIYTNCISLNSDNLNPAGPNFTNPASSDYSLTYLSPCIDKGLNTGAPVTDIIGNPRVGITDIGAYENQDFLWLGTDGTNPTFWNIAANWNRSLVPGANNNIIIRGGLLNYPVVNFDAPVNSVLIASGAQLTITPPSTLIVNGTLTNNAGNPGLVIKSASNGNDGKLINNNATVSGTVELYLSGGLVSTTVGTFHYFVPPVETMIIGSSIAEVKANLGLTNFNGDLLSYSEVAAGSNKDLGWQYFDGFNTTTGFSSINSSTGYNVYLNANDKITFTGSLNGPDHSFNGLSFTNLGWNLVGNPYPCNYDLHGISALTNTGDAVDNTVYFNHNGGYAVWNVETGAGETGYSNIMPPMQGFFVHVTAAGQSLSLPASSKTASAAGPLRSKKALSTDSKSASDVRKIKLVLNNGAVPDETIVCLIDKATTAFDGDYDAYKLFGGGSSTPFIYSELNSVKYAINSVQAPASDSIIIPLTLELKTQGTYKIDITEFENLGNTKVKLRHGAVETLLSKDASYSFTSEAGTFKDFQLIIGYADVTTGVETHTQQKIKTWYSNNYLYINCPDNLTTDKGNLTIYDIQGKMVYTNNQLSLSPGQTIQIPLPLNKGLYITHVMVNNQPFVSKIVVF